MRGIHFAEGDISSPVGLLRKYLETVQRFRARECGCERGRSDGFSAVMFQATAAQAVVS